MPEGPCACVACALRSEVRSQWRVAHIRSGEFDQALPSATGRRGGRWTDVARDPNAAAALAARASTLRSAWRPPIPDRVVFLEERCRDRRVLDVGCVAHDIERMDSTQWLHGRLAAVARACVGVDVLPDGVAAMRKRGYEVVVHDLSDGLGPLAGLAPFDVIVAGELIEHVEAVDMLFRLGKEALAPDGELVVTTPNPYAPHRVRAARRGIVWENVDHILYAFPSGMAELAERHGLVLAEAAVTDDRRRAGLPERIKQVRRRLRGRHYVVVGYATRGKPRVRRVDGGAVLRLWQRIWRPHDRLLGETFLYVVKHPAEVSP